MVISIMIIQLLPSEVSIQVIGDFRFRVQGFGIYGVKGLGLNKHIRLKGYIVYTMCRVT